MYPQDNTADGTLACAHELHQRGLNVFPLDHPAHPKCTGLHGPTSPCDGERGKHPTVKWGTWAVTVTTQMIDLAWGKHDGLANIGIACGPSNLVVLDEDQHGELDRWCVTHGITLPETYTVTTGRGRHLYFRWDHSTKRIGNSSKAMDGFAIDVRGDGGFAVAEGSQHQSGTVYTGNGRPIADLPGEVGDLLLACQTHASTTASIGAEHDFNAAMIPFKKRHSALVKYAGRLRKSGLEYAEALPVFRQRWLCCEQPEGQIPEAKFHGPPPPDCDYPVTWDDAKSKLANVFHIYPAGSGAGAFGETSGETDDDEPTTWEPVDLEPCLSGKKTQPQPCLGIYRSDGVQLIYPGREHVVLGDTESGKSWYALGCVAVELSHGRTVGYIHYEEQDETSTVERLLVLGVDPDTILQRFRFYGPMRPARREWLQPLINLKPSLVVHDGVNEAMSLHRNKQDVEGASEFRRRLVMPFTRAGIATLACDHMPMVKDSSRRDAYGTVHKGNVVDGTRIQLENFKPFGRGKRGASNVFVTKDRPGFLRAQGNATKTTGKTFMGVLAVDDMAEQPDFLMKFYAPRKPDDGDTADVDTTDSDSELAFSVWRLIYELPAHCVESLRTLYAEMRGAGMQVREADARSAVDDLVVQGRLQKLPGKRNAVRYRVRPLVKQRLLPDANYKKVFENEWDA
jgi:Bifunctional DNA primase/polymerase, N-terminal